MRTAARSSGAPNLKSAHEHVMPQQDSMKCFLLPHLNQDGAECGNVAVDLRTIDFKAVGIGCLEITVPGNGGALNRHG